MSCRLPILPVGVGHIQWTAPPGSSPLEYTSLTPPTMCVQSQRIINGGVSADIEKLSFKEGGAPFDARAFSACFLCARLLYIAYFSRQKRYSSSLCTNRIFHHTTEGICNMIIYHEGKTTTSLFLSHLLFLKWTRP